MVEMDHAVLGISAKKHVLILAGVFGALCVILVGLEVWQLPKVVEVKGELWMTVGYLLYMSFFTPISLCFGSLGLLCLLKCNGKCIVILCITWPLGIGFAAGWFSISSLTWGPSFPEIQLIYYAEAAITLLLALGSAHCALLMIMLGFCARADGGADHDLYDLEKSDSSTSSLRDTRVEDKVCIE